MTKKGNKGEGKGGNCHSSLMCGIAVVFSIREQAFPLVLLGGYGVPESHVRCNSRVGQHELVGLQGKKGRTVAHKGS